MNQGIKLLVRMGIATLVAQVGVYYVLTKGTEFLVLLTIMLIAWVSLELQWR